jgi:hypothetical protein
MVEEKVHLLGNLALNILYGLTGGSLRKALKKAVLGVLEAIGREDF